MIMNSNTAAKRQFPLPPDESAVWKRVLSGREQPAGSGKTAAAQSLHQDLAQALSDLRTLTRSAACWQRSLGGCGQGQSLCRVRSLMGEVRQQTGLLTGLYVYLTGQRPECAGEAGEILPPSDLLRTTELLAARLEALSARATGESASALLAASDGLRGAFLTALPALTVSCPGASRSYTQRRPLGK